VPQNVLEDAAWVVGGDRKVAKSGIDLQHLL
jgi:hypothetical protein